MHPLHRIAWGFLVVFVDIRMGGFDVIPDVVGWALVIAGLLKLSGEHVGYRVALSAASASVVVTLVTEYALGVATTASGPTGLWGALDTVLGTAFLFATCTALGAAAARAGDGATANGAKVVRWLDVALGVGSLAASAAAGFPAETVQVTGVMIPVLVLGVGLALLVVVWFLVLLFRCGREEYGVPAVPTTP